MNYEYMIKRIGQAVVTIFTVTTLTFLMVRYMPGGPLEYLKAHLAATGEIEDIERLNQLAEIYTGFRTDKPMVEQYVDYMTSVFLHLDLGRSMWFNKPVAEILFGALPWTVLVMGTALLISFGIAILFGAFIAYKEGSKIDLFTTISFQSLASVPYYIIALILLMILGFDLGWFPTGGRKPPYSTGGINLEFLIGIFYYATLPILSIVLAQLGRTIAMRANSISVLGENYVRVARLRGLSTRHITQYYIAPNAVLPLYTGLLISIGSVFGGSVILETIFSYPGVGYYLYQAVLFRDYVLMSNGFLLITITVVIGILIADLTYGLIDPRIKAAENH